MARRTVDDLILLSIPELREIFIETMRDIADAAIIDEMVRAIEAGDPAAAFRAAGFTPAALAPILDNIERIYKESGYLTAGGFPRRLSTPTGDIYFRFNVRNPRAEQQLRDHSTQLATRLTDEARENIRITMERGQIAGNNPRKTALDIVGRIDPVTKQRVGGVIGLTKNQELWISNARRDLENLDKRYFTRSLRDKRFDSTVLKAIESGDPLSTTTIDKLITAYKSSALRYRGESISRTEVAQAVNRASHEAHLQAVDEGALKASAVERYWDDVGDTRTRWTHNVMGVKYKKKGVGLEEPFVSPSGAKMMFPGDSSLGADAQEIINCRCRVKFKVDWFAGLDE